MLIELRGKDNEAFFGFAGLGDVNGDGADDFVVGAYAADTKAATRAGKATLFLSRGPRNPGSTSTYGVPCPDQKGRLPRARIGRQPRIGETTAVQLRYPTAATALLVIGTSKTSLPLGRCRLHVSPILRLLPATTTTPPLFSYIANIPNASEWLGREFTLQWPSPIPTAGNCALPMLWQSRSARRRRNDGLIQRPTWASRSSTC